MKSLVGERVQKIVEDRIPLEFGDIFHGHDVGPQFADEPGELRQQCPFRVVFVVESLCVFGKRLAWRASHQDAEAASGEMFQKLSARQLGHAFFMKFGG